MHGNENQEGPLGLCRTGGVAGISIYMGDYNTAEGVECAKDKIFSVQYHPESAPGPQDSAYLFDKFTALMDEGV